MMRPAALTRKLLRDSWGQRGQFLAIAGVLAAGVATLVATLSTLDTLERTRADYYRQYDFAQVFAHLKRAPESLGRELAALPGVQRLETRVVGEARLSLAGFPDPVNARLVSLPRRDGGGLNTLFLRAGRLPAPESEREVVASQAFATAHQLRPGDELAVILNGRLRRLRVVGIGLSPEYVYQIRPGDLFPDPRRYAVLWMEREGLAAALDLEGAFNDVVLRLAPGASQPRVIELLDRRLERYGGLGAYGRDRQLSARYLDQ
ncbi:MAG TPA: hypothetical protein VJ947_05980, partial [Pseudohaliea sp.]|nr:hypothetical protein [Pseudohaliea sp.]